MFELQRTREWLFLLGEMPGESSTTSRVCGKEKGGESVTFVQHSYGHRRDEIRELLRRRLEVRDQLRRLKKRESLLTSEEAMIGEQLSRLDRLVRMERGENVAEPSAQAY